MIRRYDPESITTPFLPWDTTSSSPPHCFPFCHDLSTTCPPCSHVTGAIVDHCHVVTSCMQQHVDFCDGRKVAASSECHQGIFPECFWNHSSACLETWVTAQAQGWCIDKGASLHHVTFPVKLISNPNQLPLSFQLLTRVWAACIMGGDSHGVSSIPGQVSLPCS